MTSLLGRLLRLFPESVPLEDLFTEAVARLFEARPRLCLDWLEEVGLLTRAVKRFFVESIRQLREELTVFKKEHPDLPWAGG